MEEPQDPKVQIQQEREQLKLTRGKLIRRARELLGFSQEELAREIEAASTTVSRWERETDQGPNLFHQRHLAALFGLEVEELGYLHENMTQAVFPWNVPFHRNPYFTGREAALQRLRDALLAGKSAVLTHALAGLGGLGKTQLAVEYAYHYRETYQAVLWTRADSTEALLADMTHIARLLNLRVQNKRDQVLYAVRHWLETHTDWLLICDNVEDLRTLDSVLPMGKEGYLGHIVLTTRMQALGTRAKKITLETMKVEEGATLVLRRAKKLMEDMTLDMAAERDIEKAKDISTEMGGLPLALDQAGAYIEETMCDVGDYLDLYLIRRAELLARRGDEPSGHPLSVKATFSLAVDRIRQANPAAAELLTFCAHLYPDAIPEDLIMICLPELGPLLAPIAADPLQLRDALRELGKYSLLYRDTETKTLSMHRLVQSVLQDGMDEDSHRIWAERTVQALNRVCIRSGPLDEQYLPHLQEGARLVERWGLKYQEAANLLDQTGALMGHRRWRAWDGMTQRNSPTKEPGCFTSRS